MVYSGWATVRALQKKGGRMQVTGREDRTRMIRMGGRDIGFRDRTERVRRDRPTEWIEGLVSCDGRREEEAASGGDAVLGRDPTPPLEREPEEQKKGCLPVRARRSGDVVVRVVGWQKGILLVNRLFYSGPVFPAPPPPEYQAAVLSSCPQARCPVDAILTAACAPLSLPGACALLLPALVLALAPSPQILIDLGPRAPLALLLLACLPSPSPRTHWHMHSPLQVLPVVMHSCAIRSSRRAGTHALDLAPLLRTPPATRHIDLNLDLTLCTSVPSVANDWIPSVPEAEARLRQELGFGLAKHSAP
ncbi:hypothetical protein B0H13DRAFT_1909497 [Mycena leptocephala]|nr:hypothetical protein B0H13DRAFT_1909497 [Mycena leptocephala]